MEWDKTWYTKWHNSMVDILFDYCSASPVGIGSLFRVSTQEWQNGGYQTIRKNYVLTSFGILQTLLRINPKPLMVLTCPLTGRFFHKDLRPYVKGLQDRSSYNKTSLLVAATSPIPGDWKESMIVSHDSLKEFEYFKRTGRKYDDKRHYEFSQISSAYDVIQDPKPARFDWMETEAKKTLATWDSKKVREELFIDFEFRSRAKNANHEE